MMPSIGSPNTKIIDCSLGDEARPGSAPPRGSRAGRILTAAHRLATTPRPILLPGISLPARPGLLLFTALLGFACLVLLICSRSTPPSVSEFALLTDQSCPNLNSTSAEAPAEVPAPQAVAEQTAAASPAAVPDGLQLATRELVSLPPLEFPRPFAAEEALPIVPATALEPASEGCYRIREPHLGDTPMIRTWKMLGLQTFLAALFAAPPAFSSNTSGPPTDGERLEEIQKQLNELKTALTEVKKTLAGLSTLEDRIKDIRTDANVSAQKVQAQIADLNNQITQLQDNLRVRQAGPARIAASPSLDTSPGVPTARVEMMNTYSQPVSIVLNNRRSYLLQPFERRLSDPITAGPFTYEILGVTPQVTRTVAPEKIFTVWVHPQP